jgi:hypothetical protein
MPAFGKLISEQNIIPALHDIAWLRYIVIASDDGAVKDLIPFHNTPCT